jgi:pimeloyl-ACP methyl ester carboxylesterase
VTAQDFEPVDPTYVEASDGVRLAVYEWGNPNGAEVLLIHGQAQCHLCFAGQIASDLARDCRIVAFDLRGHGAAGKPEHPRAYQDPEAWARDVATVIDAKRLARPVLVGWSMGGRVIRQYLMRFGDARLAGINFVGSMVIEDPRARGPGVPRPTPDQTLSAQIASTIGFLDACYARKPDEAAFRTALAYNMLVPVAVRAAIAGWSTDPSETVAALARLRVPVLVSHGRDDAVVLPIAAHMTAEAIQGARISWYAGCGHSPFAEDTPRFNAELAAFIGSTRHAG